MRAKAKEEHGQTLVIATIAMVVVIGMAALAIDLAVWFTTRHQAQVAADAGALAAVQDLNNGDCGTSTQTKNTITTDVTAYANTKNHASSSSWVCPYDNSSSEVRVTAEKQAPLLFSGLFHGIIAPTVHATAVAKESSTQKTTMTTVNHAGNLAIFGMGGCPKKSTDTVTVSANGATIKGSIISNGDLNLDGQNQTYTGPTITWGQGCTDNLGGNHNSFPPNQPTSASPTTTWPVCYTVPASVWAIDSSILSQTSYNASCSNPVSDPNAPVCTWSTGQSGTPPTGIAVSGSNMTINTGVGAGVYCAPLGTITVNASSANITLFAKDVKATANGAALSNDPNLMGVDTNLLAYCTDSSTSTNVCNFSGNGATYNGAIFVPGGPLTFTSNQGSVGFLEAQSVDFAGNGGSGFIGTGGTTTTTTTTTTTVFGSAGTLIQ